MFGLWKNKYETRDIFKLSTISTVNDGVWREFGSIGLFFTQLDKPR